MKRKRVLITVAIAAILLLGGVAVYLINVAGDMNPADTSELMGGVYSVRDNFVDLYIVKGSNGYIAIDSATNPDHVKKELGKLNIDPKMISAVFLTHTDYDHVGGISLFPDAKVYISAAEEQMINGETFRSKGSHNRLDREYEILNDNQTIEISGVKIQVILVPGHTPGSMAYLVNGGYLFTGDTMSLKDGKSGLFVKKYNMDPVSEAASNRKIEGLKGISALFTGHHGYTDDFVAAFSE